MIGHRKYNIKQQDNAKPYIDCLATYIYHTSQSQNHSADTTKGSQLRTSPATTSRVADTTKAYPTRARRTEEAFEEIENTPRICFVQFLGVLCSTVVFSCTGTIK